MRRMRGLLALPVLLVLCVCWSWRLPSLLRSSRFRQAAAPAAASREMASLRIGNFFPNSSTTDRFIQCHIVKSTTLGGVEYAVGTPFDTPVALTYFEANELKMVNESYQHYDHLLDHVANQLDSADITLFRTPIVLTLQGDIDDDDTDEAGEETSFERHTKVEQDVGWEVDQDSSVPDAPPPPSLEELLQRERYFHPCEGDPIDDEVDYDDNDNDDDDDDEFYSETDMPGVEVQPMRADMSDVSADSFVTDEDSRNLHRAHHKADRILGHAEDVSLLASFFYQKRIFHLVRLLEPIFFIARRAAAADGQAYCLLDDAESDRVRPALEALLLHAGSEHKNGEHAPRQHTKDATQRPSATGAARRGGGSDAAPSSFTSRRPGRQPHDGAQTRAHRSKHR